MERELKKIFLVYYQSPCKISSVTDRSTKLALTSWTTVRMRIRSDMSAQPNAWLSGVEYLYRLCVHSVNITSMSYQLLSLSSSFSSLLFNVCECWAESASDGLGGTYLFSPRLILSVCWFVNAPKILRIFPV